MNSVEMVEEAARVLGGSEKLKTESRQITIDVDIAPEANVKQLERQFRVSIEPHQFGANITGRAGDVLKMLLSDDGWGYDVDEVKDLFPEVLRAI